MIEEIKLLIPLLQQAGEGTFWLVVAFFVVDILKYLIVWGSILGIAWIVGKIVRVANKWDKSDLELNEVMHISRRDAAYEAVRIWYLYGRDGSEASRIYHDIENVVRKLKSEKK